MEQRRPIIKRGAVTSVTGAESEAPPAERLVRIPATRVDANLVVQAAELAESFRLNGVYRRGETPASVMPYVMVDLDLDPDFPLSEPASSNSEARPPAAEPEGAPSILEAEGQRRLENAVEGARAEAFEEGYEAGYVAAEAALQASFDQRKVDLEKDVARLQVAWKDFLKQSEPMMASLAFEVARQLLDAPLPQDVRAVSAQALSQALEAFAESAPIDITLHPDDHARLQGYGLTGDLEALHSSIRWQVDESIPMGDWIVQSPDSAIRRLKEEMLNHLKSRLGLLAVMKTRDA